METKTISELAELFGVTRQAMNKRVKALPEEFVEKNEKNVTVVNALGIHELEHLYGKVVTAEAEVMEQQEKHEVAVKPDDGAVFELVANLMKDKNTEIDRLQQQLTMKDQQLSTKDEQIAEKDRQIKKQQELMEKALLDQKEFMAELQKEVAEVANEKNKGFFGRIFNKK